MGKKLELTWVENEFSPAEFAAASGLSAEMQRHWRRRGLLPKKSGRTAAFTAWDIATVRLMLLLQHPLKTKALAEQIAPHVIWITLGDHPASWNIEGPPEEADTYRGELERRGSAHIDLMAGVNVRDLQRYVIITGDDDPLLVPALHDGVLGSGNEISTVIELQTVAKKFIGALKGKPIVTIRLPKEAKGKVRA